LTRVAVRQVDPATLVFFRTAPAVLLLLPWVVANGQFRVVFTRLRWVLAFTVCEYAIPWLLMSSAEKRIDSSTAALLVATVPIVLAVLHRFSPAHEKIGPKRATGLIIGALGVATLVGVSLDSSSSLGILEMGAVVLGYSIGPLIIAARLSDLPSPGVIGVSMGFVALAYLPYAAFHMPTHLAPTVISSITILSLVCTLTAFLVFFALIREVGPARSTVVTYVNPAVAIVLGVILLGEPVTAGLIAGFPMIIVGSILATGRSPELDTLQISAELR